MSEINVPVIGKTKTAYVVAGFLIVGGIVGYAYLRNRGSSSPASSAASPDLTAASSAASIDPLTGYPQGSAQDQAALAAEQSAGLGSGVGSSGYYGDGYGYSFGGIPGIPSTSANPNTGPGTFTDNAYWLAYAEENITGYSPSQIQQALSAYLNGARLTAQEYAIYQVALGVAGNPPAPPGTTPKPPSSGGGGGVSGTVSGLSAHAGPTSINVGWHPAEGAQGYEVVVLQAGKRIEGESVAGTSAAISGLHRKTRYELEVRAKPGASHSTVYATTT